MLGKIEDKRRRKLQDEMVGWHHQLNGHEFEQTPGDREGQGRTGSLVCCSPWGHKEWDTTKQQNKNVRIELQDTYVVSGELPCW